MATSRVGKAVRVLWEDAWQTDEYYDLEQMRSRKTKMLQSYGLCIRDDQQIFSIAMDEIGDGRFRDIKIIPAGMVRKVKVLK